MKARKVSSSKMICLARIKTVGGKIAVEALLLEMEKANIKLNYLFPPQTRNWITTWLIRSRNFTREAFRISDVWMLLLSSSRCWERNFRWKFFRLKLASIKVNSKSILKLARVGVGCELSCREFIKNFWWIRSVNLKSLLACPIWA